MNPITDRRLLKLIDQCRTKQVVDYVKQHCPKTSNPGEQKVPARKKKQSEDTDEEDSSKDYKYVISIKPSNEEFKVSNLEIIMSETFF